MALFARSWVHIPSETVASEKAAVLHSYAGSDPDRPVALFDFDGTLRFHKGRGPGENAALALLKSLSRGFNIVIISNQSGAGDGLEALKQFVDRADMACGKACISVYAARRHDSFRKPHTGAWEHYLRYAHGDLPPPFVFMCGDAAGRLGDFSASDFMFALNINAKFDMGVKFVTPEMLFGGEKLWADPLSIGCSAPSLTETCQKLGCKSADEREDAILNLFSLIETFDGHPFAVIMVGSPASGKSTIAKRIAVEDTIAMLVSRDILGRDSKNMISLWLSQKKSFVVDDTNPTLSGRSELIRAAAARGFCVITCHVDTPKPICFHLNAARCQLTRREELPAVAIHTFWKRFQAPIEDEASCPGSFLVHIPFAVDPLAPSEIMDFRYPLK